MTEIPINGFENYTINNIGEVRSIERYVHTYGTRKFLKKSQILKPKLSQYGYYEICLIDHCGIKNNFRVSRIVAIAFIPNPENKPYVNHINGIKTDNRVENLEWVTPLENSKHAWENGLNPVGEKHHQYKHGLNANRREYVLAWHRAKWRGFDWKKLSTEEKKSFFVR